MNNKFFSFFREGSLNFWRNFPRIALYNLLVILIGLAFLIVGTIFAAILLLARESNIFSLMQRFSAPLRILQGFLLPLLLAGYQYLFVQLLRKESSSFKTIFAGFRHFWSVVLTNYFAQAIIYAGIFLFLLPLLMITLISQAGEIPSILNFIFFEPYSPDWPLKDVFPAAHVFLILILLTLLFAGIYWGFKLLFTELAAVDRKLNPADAIYYAVNISRGNIFKIFLNQLPILIITLSIILIPLFTLNKHIASLTALIWVFLFLFVLTPWSNSIIAAAYVSLSDEFDENLSEEYLERFTVKTNSRNEDDNKDNDNEDNNENENENEDKNEKE